MAAAEDGERAAASRDACATATRAAEQELAPSV